MRLQHFHIPGLTRYELVSSLQNLLVRQKISYQHPSSAAFVPSLQIATDIAASPLLVTYTSQPTYTSGRRQTLSPSQIHLLEHASSGDSVKDATYVHSPRGGLLTFHGPGQLTAYPILHLRSHDLTVRSYVSFLESAIIRTLGRYGVEGFTRPEYPGVWVSPTQKIASVGVHVQRGVTCFGIGLNVSTQRRWWDRFAACGIEGVEMVGLQELGVTGVEGEKGVSQVGEGLAGELTGALAGVEGMEVVEEGESKALLRLAESTGLR